MAKYCDSLLKKSNKPQEYDLEDQLDQVMVVFKYVQDKDVFEQFYSSRLAVRIVQKLSASDDAEASMISRLKQACGYEYTRKLQNMINDIGLSKATEPSVISRVCCRPAEWKVEAHTTR